MALQLVSHYLHAGDFPTPCDGCVYGMEQIFLDEHVLGSNPKNSGLFVGFGLPGRYFSRPYNSLSGHNLSSLAKVKEERFRSTGENPTSGHWVQETVTGYRKQSHALASHDH